MVWKIPRSLNWMSTEKAQALGISLSDVNQTISTALGGTYVNDFIDHGRVKRSMSVPMRASVCCPVTSATCMYAALMVRWFLSPPLAPRTGCTVHLAERYNGMPSMEIIGESAPGKSTGEAMALMESLAAKLPSGIGYDWTGMSYQERLSGNQAPALYAISLIVVFLCLAALYESWSIPFSVMLVVPLGVIGALVAAALRGLNNDVYFRGFADNNWFVG